jgi:16S rRNA (guanine966-N2)-methyltransferase
LRRKKLTIVGTIAQNGAHGSTGPRIDPMNAARHGGPAGSVRIVGGRWRGTRLPVADSDGLRPTADRVRETLFNWLQPVLPGARVLDLFAGSGALGLETVSRGAREAVLVERDARLAAMLRDTVARLDAGRQVEVAQADALSWLRRPAPAQPFDLVFVDPPFAAALWPAVLEALPAVLAEDAWLYLEGPAGAPPVAGADWVPHRAGSTRDTHYALYRFLGRSPAGAATLHAVPGQGGATPG